MMKPRPAILLLAALAGAAHAACGSRTVRAPEAPGESLIVLLPDADSGRVGRAVVSNAAGRTELIDARHATLVSARRPPSPAAPIGEGDVRGIFGDALDALPAPPRTFTLFFRFDSEELTPESTALASEIARVVRERRVPEVLIVGHTDTTGTRAVNFELGLRRANRVRGLLREAGLELPVVDVISHGETELLVSTGDGVFEPRNRRVEITLR
jgi:outer membrane protein OmpA-like peptidoglycan-associated protein